MVFASNSAGPEGRPTRSDTTRTEDNVHRRAGAHAHTGRDVAVSFSVLVLIMIGALTVCWLLSLPHSVVH
jgi:hypothetical protein